MTSCIVINKGDGLMMKTYEYGDSVAQVVLIQPVDDHDMDLIENEIAYIRDNTEIRFKLIAFKINDWNKDLSPWKAPAVFGKDDFGDNADSTLNEILEYCKDGTKTYYLGGYSLAGLFSLWASYQTDLFSGVAAASPSMWFPKFTDYMKNHTIKSCNVYLSLGDKEEKTRNPVMAEVGNKISEAYNLLKDNDINCTLEWNEGNHFKDADFRTAKAFLWVLKNSRV